MLPLSLKTLTQKQGSRTKARVVATALTALLLGALASTQPSHATSQVNLIINGAPVTADPAPMIKNDRTVVPLRVVSEALGAQVTWNAPERAVLIEKDGRRILLRIDRSLVDYEINGNKIYQFSDVSPFIYQDRTFVPLRLISNALGVGIEWEGATRTVRVDASKISELEPFFQITLTSPGKNALISGTTPLQAAFASAPPAGAAQISFLLVSPETGKGYVIARGSDLAGVYQWVPKLRDQGQKILVAAMYDAAGKFLGADASPVRVALSPSVNLDLSGLGADQNGEQAITESVKLSPRLNFSAAYVKYEIRHAGTGKTIATDIQDPLGTYTWTPTFEYNGTVTVQLTAYDQKHQAFPGQALTLKVNVPRKIAMGGVRAGQTLNRPVSLIASRNFDVLETEYLLRDPVTQKEDYIAKVPYGAYTWFPGPELKGAREVLVRVKAMDGQWYASASVSVTLTGAHHLLLQGAGPDQVITPAVPAKLKVQSNFTPSRVRYLLTHAATGKQKVLADLSGGSFEFTYTPVQGDDGLWKLKAVATTTAGQTVETEAVNVTVFTGKLYGPQPVIEKSKFLGMASSLAVHDFKSSGMSAALQTAQAILETGWGQSVPVDKYTGRLSSNLFGIKGTGPAGAVTSNTWEEYNGVAFRVDAKFRAYYSVNDSWADHKKFLLTGARYEPFRQVMYDSSLGAWALKRAGYATDSKYPIKLMDLIETYNLYDLDLIDL